MPCEASRFHARTQRSPPIPGTRPHAVRLSDTCRYIGRNRTRRLSRSDEPDEIGPKFGQNPDRSQHADLDWHTRRRSLRGGASQFAERTGRSAAPRSVVLLALPAPRGLALSALLLGRVLRLTLPHQSQHHPGERGHGLLAL